jgi:hypothetical protein
VFCEGLDVGPGAQARVDLRVVDRVETGVGAVDRVEERQQVHTAEDAGQRAVAREQRRHFAQAAAAQAIDVGDELNLILHAFSSAVRTNNTHTAATMSKVPASRITLAGLPPSRLW